MGKRNRSNHKKKSQQIELGFTLMDMDDITCDICGHGRFGMEFILKRYPKSLNKPRGFEFIQTAVCKNCEAVQGNTPINIKDGERILGNILQRRYENSPYNPLKWYSKPEFTAGFHGGIFNLLRDMQAAGKILSIDNLISEMNQTKIYTEYNIDPDKVKGYLVMISAGKDVEMPVK